MRLQRASRTQLIAPMVVIFSIAVAAFFGASQPGVQPRESVFDLFARMTPRPVDHLGDVIVVDIDEDSAEQLGPWPWPRSALASLLTAAYEAEAATVTLVLPTDGPDVLSPEIVARAWSGIADSEDVIDELARLPTTNATLAGAAAEGAASVGIGDYVADSPGPGRVDMAKTSWARLSGVDPDGFVALPMANLNLSLDPGLRETGFPSVISLPVDEDGIFRGAPLMWAEGDVALPSPTLASLISQGASPVIISPSGRVLTTAGALPAAIQVADLAVEQEVDPRRGVRLWLPGDISVQDMSAWRVLEGGETWTRPLKNKRIFVGASIDPGSTFQTARGPLQAAAIHAHLTSQFLAGDLPKRPGWAAIFEGATALFFGGLALFLALALRPPSTMGLVAVLVAVAWATTFLIFRQTQLLVDPLPATMAAVGAPLMVFMVFVGQMIRGGEVARGAFHGALPTRTISKIQTSGPKQMLAGHRRPVAVLSCGLRLPDDVAQRFEARPSDFIDLIGAANDALRRTILQSGGTVDYGEDGRLLGYWNVPEEIGDPIESACACGLRMIEEIDRLTDNVKSSAYAGALSGTALEEGFAEAALDIGIATGMCFAGPVGRGLRNRYAVIGEAVGMASALRARARHYGPAIITDDEVFDALRHQYAFLDLDVIRLGHGEDSTKVIYGLSGNSFLKASRTFRTLADAQRELVTAWRANDRRQVTMALQKLRAIPGVPDAYIRLFDQRLTAEAPETAAARLRLDRLDVA